MDGSHIREIRADGIVYVDDEGEQKFIDFFICYDNYVKKRTSADYRERFKMANKLSDEDFDEHVERVKAWPEVGARQILGQPWDDGPYVEFYTEPLVRFYLTEAEYGQVIGKIHQLGWQTFDRS